MSPRAGPTIAEPVSCAIIRRRKARRHASGSASSGASTQTGVWNVWSVRSTARLRPAVSGTPAAPSGPSVVG